MTMLITKFPLFPILGLWLCLSAPGPLIAAGVPGRTADSLSRAPLLSPDRVPSIRIQGLASEVHGKYLNAYYLSATRISVGDGIPGLPHVREIRRVHLNLETQTGELILPEQTFERNSLNRVNMIVLVGQDQPQSRSIWINPDRSCPVGVGTCERNPDLLSFGVLTVDDLQRTGNAGETAVNAEAFLRKRARRP